MLLGSPKCSAFEALARVAADHGASPTTIGVTWLLRQPAHMQPVIGTMNAERLRECCQAADVDLSREERCALYRAAGGPLPWPGLAAAGASTKSASGGRVSVSR